MAMPTINGREVKVGDRLYSYLFASWGEVIKKKKRYRRHGYPLSH